MLELAREADLEAIARINAQAHALHVAWRPDLYCPMDGAFRGAYYLECLRERRLFVARINGIVVGYALFRIWSTGGTGNVPRKILDIDSFAVEETCRGQGIGTKMMEDLWALARAMGCSDLQLSVYPQNDAAVSFYQKCGFMIRNINMQRKV